jgi:hypothetical protein
MQTGLCSLVLLRGQVKKEIISSYYIKEASAKTMFLASIQSTIRLRAKAYP